jgi:diguanylate cyclase (GGDEF)-like protein
LGLQAVRQLTLTFSLLDRYATGSCVGFDYAGFWSHSLLMGLALSEVAGRQRLGSPDELFTCGLLARVGCLGLATAYPKDYGRLLATGTVGIKLQALEQELLHVDHIQLSCALMEQWGLPEALVDPVAFQEHPASAPFAHSSRSWSLSHCLHLSEQIANFAVAPKAEQPLKLSLLTEAASTVGIDPTELGQCMDKLLTQWTTWGERLRLSTSKLPSFETMVSTMVRPDETGDAQALRVMIVEDEPIILNLLEMWLRTNHEHTLLTAVNGRDALEKAVEFKPHVLLTDWKMPVMDGIELCHTLRSSDWGQSIYVVMLTSADQEDDLVQAFDAGVDDFLTKPVNMRALDARLKGAWRYVRLREAWELDHERLTRMAAELALSNRRLQQAALTDPLTSLANRRAGLNVMAQSWSAASRHAQALSVISLDIDHFKSINDVHGHATGDAVLQSIANTLQAASRKEDTVCRWGGEEFLIISPNVELGDAVLVAERLRMQIADNPILVNGASLRVTSSFGVAAWESELTTQDQLLSHSDQALYGAKSAGRNRVATFLKGKVRTH